MGKRLGFVLSAVGMVLMLFGGLKMGPEKDILGLGDRASTVRIIVIGAGVVATFLGMALILADVHSKDSEKNKGVKKDNPTRVRLVGVAVTLVSLALPYIRVPLEIGADRTGQSLISLVNALRTGGEVDFVLLFLMSVVFIGAFISILHHIGGYLILFGTAFYGYLGAELLGMNLSQVLLSEFQLGLYVAVGGSLIIVGSSIMSYEAVDRDRSFVGGRRK